MTVRLTRRMPSYFRVKELLERKHMSQSELSRKSSVSLARVNELCSGRAKAISLDVLDKLAGALEVEGKDLIGTRRNGSKVGAGSS